MDLQRAYMLMLLIKEAGLHGTVYKPFADQAAAELRDMLEPTKEEIEQVETEESEGSTLSLGRKL